MTSEQREQVLEKARVLLPKYGGFAGGAVNQAMLVLGIRFDKDEYRSLVQELECGTSASG